MNIDLQKMAKADVNWNDLYYSRHISISRKNIENFGQNPLSRFMLEDTARKCRRQGSPLSARSSDSSNDDCPAG